MKKIKRIFIILLCASMLWGCGKSESTTETVSESAPKDLRELNEECITVETGETEMDTETEGTVQLSVEFPDYKSLYLEANESEDPEEFVQEALQQKKFKTCKTEITARVAVENGETVIYKEEAINRPDYELGMGLKDNSAYRKTARRNRLMTRAMKRKR